MTNYRTILIFSVLSFFTFQSNIYGQHGDALEIDGASVTIHDVMAKPESYSSTIRAEVFTRHASEYFSRDLDSAMYVFRHMIEVGDDLNDHFMMGRGYGGIGQLLIMKGDYEQCVPELKRACKYFASYPQDQALQLGSLGGAYLMLNAYDSAEYYSYYSINMLYDLKDTMYYSAAHLNRGIVLVNQQMYYSALDHYLTAIKYADYAILPMRKGDIYNKVAITYAHINDIENAIKYKKLALTISEEKGYKKFESELCTGLGSLYRKVELYDEALTYLDRAKKYQVAKQAHEGLIATYSNIALIKTATHDMEAASQYLEKAKEILRHVENDRNKTIYFTALGKYALANDDYNISKSAFNTVHDYGTNAGSSNTIIRALEGLIAINSAQGKYKKAYELSDRLINTQRELDLTNQQKLIYDLDGRYQQELKNAKITELNTDFKIQTMLLNKNKRLLYFSIAGLILAFVAIFAFYFAFQVKHKSNIKLAHKNKQLQEALSANKMLVKEIHHRVKNNLQVVSSLLSLQSKFEKNDSVVRAINTGKYRVQAMSLLHQKLYVNEDLNSVSIKTYFEDLISSIVDGYPLGDKQVDLSVEIDDIELDVDSLVPLGLISNELITNTLKYAFAGQESCKLNFRITEAKEKVRLIVSDNGIGIGFTELPARSKSMGMQLIQSFATKLKAKVEIDNFKGTEFKLTFDRQPVKAKLKRLQNAAS